MGLIVRHSDGSEFINIENNTYDEVSTSLKIPGKGVLNWGEAYINNFVHLMENFASAREPRSPQIGQIWYNTKDGHLSVFTIKQEWEIINKDTDIEGKFDYLFDKLSHSNAADIAPTNPEEGSTWFDTTNNVLKIFNDSRWQSFNIHSSSSFIVPNSNKESDLWFDKNIKNLKLYDGEKFQRLLSSVESNIQPIGASVGQFWTNTSTGEINVLKELPTGEQVWQELGTNDVTEGDNFSKDAVVGALHIKRDTLTNINVLFVNKGTQQDPIWTEIPEFSGAIRSQNEPMRVLDGMLWLDFDDNLRIRKNSGWVDIDPTAIAFINDTLPESAKNGMIWFDTDNGDLKIKLVDGWKNIQNKGLIEYGDAPRNPTQGQLWFNNFSKKLEIFDGERWTDVVTPSTIIGYQTPESSQNGQFWLDTTTSELKVKKDGRWAVLPENATAHISIPTNPKHGEILYINKSLKIYDGESWNDININIDNSVEGAITYDELSHEIIINNDGLITRVPLAIQRDVIIENVGITSDVVEIIKPNIKEGQRRIINIQNVNLDNPFLVFKNGRYTDDFYTDNQDLILNIANGDDVIDIIQFNGDTSTRFSVFKFISNVNGNFTIDNYTRTQEEQKAYNIVKYEYDAKLLELIEAHGENSSEEDLTSEDQKILSNIEAKFPIKESNNIADLSLGSVMVFKEGVFIPTDKLSINENNLNQITIPSTNVGEEYVLIQLIAGKDYKSSYFIKEHKFIIGAINDNTESTLNVKGKMMDDYLNMASKNTSSYGEIEIPYSYNKIDKIITFDLNDIDENYHFFITRNDLFISNTNYKINENDHTVSLYANNQDEIRFFQFYLPHNYIPVEFNYSEMLASQNGWISTELSKDFDITKPLLVFRNGLLQENKNINVITEEKAIDAEDNTYIVSGLRKIQLFGDKQYDDTFEGIQIDDIITIVQVAQPEIYHIFLEEFESMDQGSNIFEFKNIKFDKDFMIYKNGSKLDPDEYSINENGKLIVSNCNAPSKINDVETPGDKIIVYQFYTIDNYDVEDLVISHEIISASANGSENFILNHTDYLKDEFLLIFKNGQMITRRQSENENTTSTQINTFKVYSERVFNNQKPAIDGNGEPIYDNSGNPVMNVDPDDYTDIIALNIDNVVDGENISIFEFNKKVVNINNLSGFAHHEILPQNNIQRIYTSKFDQLSDLTMIFQDGLIIDRMTDSVGNDLTRLDGMARVYGQYAVDNLSKSLIINDWKVNGKIRVQQFTAQDKDIKTITVGLKVQDDGVYDVFIPNNETYIPNTGALEIYVDRQIQWSGEDYQEVANNRVLFNRQLFSDQDIKIIIRK